MTTIQNQPSLTPSGRKRLRAELDRLMQTSEEVGARLREELQEKDNDFNRYLTHEELAKLRSRIVEIETALATSEAPSANGNNGIVSVGSSVTVRDDSGREQSFTIVSPIETDAGRGFISFTSPVGAALLGKQAGDVLSIPVPKGERQLTVIEIK